MAGVILGSNRLVTFLTDNVKSFKAWMDMKVVDSSIQKINSCVRKYLGL